MSEYGKVRAAPIHRKLTRVRPNHVCVRQMLVLNPAPTNRVGSVYFITDSLTSGWPNIWHSTQITIVCPTNGMRINIAL